MVSWAMEGKLMSYMYTHVACIMYVISDARCIPRAYLLIATYTHSRFPGWGHGTRAAARGAVPGFNPYSPYRGAAERARRWENRV